MIDEKEIAEEINQMKGLQNLVRVYEEIASFRMKKVRDSVLKNRKFQNEINEVFKQVRESYAREARLLAKKRGVKGSEKITFLAHNGKTVAVLLSANTGLYGDIVHSTYNTFIEDVRKSNSEVTIIGRYGLSMFLAEEPNRPYTYFDLDDSGVTIEDLDKIIKHIVQYEEIHVYYGEFVNVISQRANMLVVSAEISLKEEVKVQTPYLFEPTLENILMFFETEIFASVFDQAVREGQLAKFASRVMAMNKSDTNIIEKLKQLRIEKLKISHKAANRKQLNSLSSLFIR